MKKFTLLLVMVLFVAFMTSCSTDAIDDAPAAMNISNLVVPETKTIEIEIMELINDYRLTKGLNPLNNVAIIKAQAFSHTDYMIVKNNVSHDNFLQRKLNLESSLGASNVSENVAYGFTSAQTVVTAWLKSESHKANIEGDFTDFELSADQNAEGNWYYTNIFVKK
ncbi:CAP domain-containing protein [Bizionia myxarmorum]|uniref:CAP domain-containing protein n=1 Tax=Bizionia myxarmorum TaxID=291186 RepID=A0A5D0RFX3_9FLAO|nr:CAP domain-containing protein [Bizionia myxarmorum]TYB79866.1 CAP domain-containing protein [Bizionia myxarmorum]